MAGIQALDCPARIAAQMKANDPIDPQLSPKINSRPHPNKSHAPHFFSVNAFSSSSINVNRSPVIDDHQSIVSAKLA